MDTSLNLDSIYNLSKEDILDPTLWPKNSNDQKEILNQIKDELKKICKNEDMNLEIIPNRRDKNRNILFIFRYGALKASCAFDSMQLLLLKCSPTQIATIIFKTAWEKPTAPGIFNKNNKEVENES